MLGTEVQGHTADLLADGDDCGHGWRAMAVFALKASSIWFRTCMFMSRRVWALCSEMFLFVPGGLLALQQELGWPVPLAATRIQKAPTNKQLNDSEHQIRL